MDTNKRVDLMEGELKLIKGELKQTLSGVRDFLLELKLPPPPADTYINEDDSGGAGPPSFLLSQDIPRPLSSETGERPLPEMPRPPAYRANDLPQAMPYPSSDRLQAAPWPVKEVEPSILRMTGEPLMEQRAETPATEQPVYKQPSKHVEYEPFENHPVKRPLEKAKAEELPDKNTEETATGQPDLSSPHVNLLANLMRWVSMAKKEIGDEQLPALVELYASSRYLSPEMKQFILHLTGLIGQQSSELSPADIWSYLILHLHGILAEGGMALSPLGQSWTNHNGKVPDETEPEKQEDRQVRLKLVLPGGNGTEKEYSLVLAPGDESRDSLNGVLNNILVT